MPEAGRRSSIARALEQAAEQLARAGVGGGGGGGGGNAKREATALWAALEGLRPGDVWLRRERAVPGAVEARFWEAVQRRSSGIPFAYAVGRVSFRHLELKLDQRALVPRPETEGLVDLVLDWCRHVQRATCNVQRGRVAGGGWGVAADIGAGCGCIALALATEGDFERVIAVERSAEAAALARENVKLVAPPVPVDVREGDLLSPLAERCRVIVANPPYLTEQEYGELDPAVRQFEPREALVSGADGLDATRALLAGACARLEPSGLLALEIDERRAPAVEALARALGWRGVSIHEDLFGRPRYALALAPEDP